MAPLPGPVGWSWTSWQQMWLQQPDHVTEGLFHIVLNSNQEAENKVVGQGQDIPLKDMLPDIYHLQPGPTTTCRIFGPLLMTVLGGTGNILHVSLQGDISHSNQRSSPGGDTLIFEPW